MVAGGGHRRPVGLVGVLRGRLTACMARPCYAVGCLQKHARDVCGAFEEVAGGRHRRPVGLVGVLHGHSMACMACPCYAIGSLQKHADDVGRGMTSPPLDCTHGRTTSGVTCHHRLWTAHSVKRRLVWHVIIAVGQHTRSNDVGRGMISPLLECTHGRTTSGVAYHHRRWTAHSVGNTGRGMKSPPLDSTHGRMTSVMAFRHRLWAAHTVKQRRAWHDITALGQHTQSDDVEHGMTSPPLDSTHGRQRRAWHDITALGQYTQLDDVGRCMTSPPLDSTHGRTTSGMA